MKKRDTITYTGDIIRVCGLLTGRHVMKDNHITRILLYMKYR